MENNKKLIRKITAKKVLAVVFFVFVFYIFAIRTPDTINRFNGYKVLYEKDIQTIQYLMDEEYLNLLKFEGNVIQNKGSYINFSGLMARAIGQKELNGRVMLANGHLTGITPEQDVTIAASQLIRLCSIQRENEKQFLFVLAPAQIPKHENILPAGYKDCSNQNSDDLLAILRKNGVPTLDLRNEMIRDGIDPSGAFFVTDHHWKTETGFWAYTKIVDYFEKNGIIEKIDSKYTDLNEYHIDIQKNSFLGAAGKRTGIYFAGIDDFSFISPKFETNLQLEIPAAGMTLQGDFSAVAYRTNLDRRSLFVYDAYGAYWHGLQVYLRCQNRNAPVDLRIMLAGDSFANTSLMYLPLIFSTVDKLDMRYYQDDFAQYYSDYSPDIVVVMMNAADDKVSETFKFF